MASRRKVTSLVTPLSAAKCPDDSRECLVATQQIRQFYLNALPGDVPQKT